MKVLALFCLRSGAAVNFATAWYAAQDIPLAQKLWCHLHEGDVLVGDRAFCDFVSLALLPARGVDVVARLHQKRSADFSQAHKCHGLDDAVFLWKKPQKRPGWMSQGRWMEVPEEVAVRVIRSRIERPGFRTQEVLIATSLLDPQK